MGTKIHSRMFPGYFLPHVYVSRSDIKTFIVANTLPYGAMADKMTCKHLTRHMVGIRVSIWDLRSSTLSKDVYIQCFPIKDVTGLGVTEHIIGTLEAFGLDRAYQRDNLSGCAMDDQYIRLNVSDHLSDIFVNNYHITWDPAHRIELTIKDSNSNEKQSFIESVTDTMKLSHMENHKWIF